MESGHTKIVLGCPVKYFNFVNYSWVVDHFAENFCIFCVEYENFWVKEYTHNISLNFQSHFPKLFCNRIPLPIWLLIYLSELKNLLYIDPISVRIYLFDMLVEILGYLFKLYFYAFSMILAWTRQTSMFIAK